MDIKGEIESSKIIVGAFNTPLTSMDISSRQKINKGTLTLNDPLDQRDLIVIYRTFHPKAAEYTVFASAQGTFSRIDDMLGHKTRLSKFKKTEIISSIFSNHKVGIYEARNQLQEKNCKNRNTWRLNNMLLNNQWVTEEYKEEI